MPSLVGAAVLQRKQGGEPLPPCPSWPLLRPESRLLKLATGGLEVTYTHIPA